MLKKFSFLKKIKKNKSIEAESETKSESAANLTQQKELDKKLVYSLNRAKVPTLKQLKYLPRVVDPKQRLILKSLVALIAASLIFIAVNFYCHNFLPTPIVGGEYTEGLIGAPQYINPVLSQTNDVDSDISRLIFSGLLKYDKELQLVPDLAGNWQISDDKKIYTFVLKPDLKWHDGEPLTADDLVFTFQSIKDPAFKSPLLISFRGVEIEKIDDLTVKFILPEPYPAFLEILTAGILPEHIWGEIPPINANLTTYNLKPIGSGPWQFESFKRDQLGNIKSYSIIPNPNYYGPKPYLKRMTFKFYSDFESAVSALKNNSIEGISFLPKHLKTELKSRKNLKFYSFYLPQYTAIFFNQKENEILKDKKIREALALGVDKSKILTEALQLEGEIIDGPILPVTVDQNNDKKIEFNPDLANQILEEAGFKKITPEQYQEFLKAAAEKKAIEQEQAAKEEGAQETQGQAAATTTENNQETEATPAESKPTSEPTQSFYRQKAEMILEITLTTVNQTENRKAAELIRDSWQNIGFKVNLEIIEAGKIGRQVIKPRSYQILLFGIIVGSNPDPYPFWHSSQIQDPGLNLALLANREIDSLLEEAKKTTDPQIQQKNYQRFNDILAAEIPAIFLYHPTYTYVADQKIKGINLDQIVIPADRFNNLEDWYVKTKRRWHGAID